MKLTQLLTAALLLGGTVSTLAQGVASSFTPTLTVSFSKPGTALRDEDGKILKGDEAEPAYSNEWTVSKTKRVKIEGEYEEVPVSDEAHFEEVHKIGIYKIGTKQILLALLTLDALPGINDKDPTISGWSLVVYGQGEGDEEGAGFVERRVYARHDKSKTMLDLSEVGISIPSLGLGESTIEEDEGEAGGDDARALSYSYTSSFKTTYKNDDESYSSSASGKYSGKKTASFNWFNGTINGRGLWTETGKFTFVTYKSKEEDEDGKLYTVTTKVPLWLPAASKLANIVGTVNLDTFAILVGSGNAVLEGKVSVSAGKIIKNTASYFGEEEEELD